MNRVLIAAGLAVAFHAGLFWWGRDWTWAPAGTPGITTGILSLKLTTPPGAAAPEEEKAVAVGQSRPGPESKPTAAIDKPRQPGRQASEAPPVMEPALKTNDTTQAWLTTPAAEAEKVQTGGEPGPVTTAEESAFTEPANEPAMTRSSESSAAGAGKDNRQEEERNRKTAAANGTTGGLIAAEPLYRLNPPPPYPPAARQRHYQGTVLLEVLVDEGGKVGELRVARSSGHPLLDRAALNAVRHWRFEPGRRHGVNIAMWVQIPVRFVLD
jgi:periplasmic protein TonB